MELGSLIFALLALVSSQQAFGHFCALIGREYISLGGCLAQNFIFSMLPVTFLRCVVMVWVEEFAVGVWAAAEAVFERVLGRVLSVWEVVMDGEVLWHLFGLCLLALVLRLIYFGARNFCEHETSTCDTAPPPPPSSRRSRPHLASRAQQAALPSPPLSRASSPDPANSTEDAGIKASELQMVPFGAMGIKHRSPPAVREESFYARKRRQQATRPALVSRPPQVLWRAKLQNEAVAKKPARIFLEKKIRVEAATAPDVVSTANDVMGKEDDRREKEKEVVGGVLGNNVGGETTAAPEVVSTAEQTVGMAEKEAEETGETAGAVLKEQNADDADTAHDDNTITQEKESVEEPAAPVPEEAAGGEASTALNHTTIIGAAVENTEATAIVVGPPAAAVSAQHNQDNASAAHGVASTSAPTTGNVARSRAVLFDPATKTHSTTDCASDADRVRCHARKSKLLVREAVGRARRLALNLEAKVKHDARVRHLSPSKMAANAEKPVTSSTRLTPRDLAPFLEDYNDYEPEPDPVDRSLHMRVHAEYQEPNTTCGVPCSFCEMAAEKAPNFTPFSVNGRHYGHGLVIFELPGWIFGKAMELQTKMEGIESSPPKKASAGDNERRDSVTEGDATEITHSQLTMPPTTSQAQQESSGQHEHCTSTTGDDDAEMEDAQPVQSAMAETPSQRSEDSGPAQSPHYGTNHSDDTEMNEAPPAEQTAAATTSRPPNHGAMHTENKVATTSANDTEMADTPAAPAIQQPQTARSPSYAQSRTPAHMPWKPAGQARYNPIRRSQTSAAAESGTTATTAAPPAPFLRGSPLPGLGGPDMTARHSAAAQSGTSASRTPNSTAKPWIGLGTMPAYQGRSSTAPSVEQYNAMKQKKSDSVIASKSPRKINTPRTDRRAKALEEFRRQQLEAENEVQSRSLSTNTATTPTAAAGTGTNGQMGMPQIGAFSFANTTQSFTTAASSPPTANAGMENQLPPPMPQPPSFSNAKVVQSASSVISTAPGMASSSGAAPALPTETVRLLNSLRDSPSFNAAVAMSKSPTTPSRATTTSASVPQQSTQHFGSFSNTNMPPSTPNATTSPSGAAAASGNPIFGNLYVQNNMAATPKTPYYIPNQPKTASPLSQANALVRRLKFNDPFDQKFADTMIGAGFGTALLQASQDAIGDEVQGAAEDEARCGLEEHSKLGALSRTGEDILRKLAQRREGKRRSEDEQAQKKWQDNIDPALLGEEPKLQPIGVTTGGQRSVLKCRPRSERSLQMEAEQEVIVHNYAHEDLEDQKQNNDWNDEPESNHESDEDYEDSGDDHEDDDENMYDDDVSEAGTDYENWSEVEPNHGDATDDGPAAEDDDDADDLDGMYELSDDEKELALRAEAQEIFQSNCKTSGGSNSCGGTGMPAKKDDDDDDDDDLYGSPDYKGAGANGTTGPYFFQRYSDANYAQQNRQANGSQSKGTAYAEDDDLDFFSNASNQPHLDCDIWGDEIDEKGMLMTNGSLKDDNTGTQSDEMYVDPFLLQNSTNTQPSGGGFDDGSANMQPYNTFEGDFNGFNDEPAARQKTASIQSMKQSSSGDGWLGSGAQEPGNNNMVAARVDNASTDDDALFAPMERGIQARANKAFAAAKREVQDAEDNKIDNEVTTIFDARPQNQEKASGRKWNFVRRKIPTLSKPTSNLQREAEKLDDIAARLQSELEEDDTVDQPQSGPVVSGNSAPGSNVPTSSTFAPQVGLAMVPTFTPQTNSTASNNSAGQAQPPPFTLPRRPSDDMTIDTSAPSFGSSSNDPPMAQDAFTTPALFMPQHGLPVGNRRMAHRPKRGGKKQASGARQQTAPLKATPAPPPESEEILWAPSMAQHKKEFLKNEGISTTEGEENDAWLQGR